MLFTQDLTTGMKTLEISPHDMDSYLKQIRSLYDFLTSMP